jgi:hypothetical protein
MASKEKSKPSSWHIWGTKNLHKWIKNEKVMAPQNRGAQKRKCYNTYKPIPEQSK